MFNDLIHIYAQLFLQQFIHLFSLCYKCLLQKSTNYISTPAIWTNYLHDQSTTLNSL